MGDGTDSHQGQGGVGSGVRALSLPTKPFCSIGRGREGRREHRRGEGFSSFHNEGQLTGDCWHPALHSAAQMLSHEIEIPGTDLRVSLENHGEMRAWLRCHRHQLFAARPDKSNPTRSY